MGNLQKHFKKGSDVTRIATGWSSERRSVRRLETGNLEGTIARVSPEDDEV